MSLALRYFVPEPEREGAPSSGVRPNVVLVSLDTLRVDRVGAYAEAGLTPNLDALAERGTVFEYVISPAPLTLPAHTSLLSGLNPPRHGVRHNGTYRVSDDVELLSERFRSEGYRTGAFVGAFVLDARFHLDQGFELYDDDFGRRSDGALKSERRAEAVVRSFLDWLESVSSDEPFFAFVHLFDAHAPYRAPAPFDAKFRDAPYNGEVAYLDACLGELFSALRERQERTVVAVTADHGEGLGDHGEQTHGLFAYESTLRVPLILAGPGADRGGLRVRPRVRTVDIYPTLLSLAGVEVPDRIDGQSLVALLDRPSSLEVGNRDVYFEALSSFFDRGGAPLTGIYRQEYKYIRVPIPELYDLSKDPGERRNIATQKPRVTAQMNERLGVFEEQRRGDLPSVLDADIDRERFASLGYILARTDDSYRREFAEEDDPKRILAYYQRLDEAMLAYQRGRADDAIQLLEDLLSERPSTATAHLYLARIHREKGSVDEAIEVLRGALRIQVDTPAIRDVLGVLLNEQHRFEESVRILEPLVQTHPEALRAHESLGMAYAALGRLADARRVFEAMLELSPTHARIRLYLAQVRAESGHYADAVDALERLIADSSELRGRAWAGLGKIYAMTDRGSMAIHAWQNALSSGDQNPETRLLLAIALEEQDRAAEAVLQFEAFLHGTASRSEFEEDGRIARTRIERLRGSLKLRPRASSE